MDKPKTSGKTLRDCAGEALKQEGFIVRNKPGLGVSPGARLWMYRPGEARRLGVVRISKKRKIGISRNERSGNWFDLPDLKEVIVVSPSLDDPNVVDVYNFNAQELLEIFDRLDEERNGPVSKNRKSNFSIFVALDPEPGDEVNSISSNLIEKAVWKKKISLATISSAGVAPPARAESVSRLKGSQEGFLERVRREYAELNGVDVKNVFINIRYEE